MSAKYYDHRRGGINFKKGGHLPLEQRIETFWKLVHKKPSGCWEWTGTLKKGYGTFYYAGKQVPTHRFSWLIRHGSQATQCVLHRCDNRKCVNPAHLFEGSKADNNYDMIAKGRNRAGRWKAKLSIEQGRFIRSIYRPKIMTKRMISEQYGIPYSSVAYAVSTNGRKSQYA